MLKRKAWRQREKTQQINKIHNIVNESLLAMLLFFAALCHASKYARKHRQTHIDIISAYMDLDECVDSHENHRKFCAHDLHLFHNHIHIFSPIHIHICHQVAAAATAKIRAKRSIYIFHTFIDKFSVFFSVHSWKRYDNMVMVCCVRAFFVFSKFVCCNLFGIQQPPIYVISRRSWQIYIFESAKSRFVCFVLQVKRICIWKLIFEQMQNLWIEVLTQSS